MLDTATLKRMRCLRSAVRGSSLAYLNAFCEQYANTLLLSNNPNHIITFVTQRIDKLKEPHNRDAFLDAIYKRTPQLKDLKFLDKSNSISR